MHVIQLGSSFVFFFFTDTATSDIYTLSLHDALPISLGAITSTALSSRARSIWLLKAPAWASPTAATSACGARISSAADRKSTRLNSSHGYISYAVFCLKKKKIKYTHTSLPKQILIHP